MRCTLATAFFITLLLVGCSKSVEKDGVTIDWTVQQHRDNDVSVHLTNRTGK
jgi:hypothetical protein